MKKDRSRKRLVVSVSRSLLKRLEELAETDRRPVAYLAGYFIESSVDKFGRESFGDWLRKRIRSRKKKDPDLGMRQTADSEKERIMVLVADESIPDLEWLANAMDCTPVKLAGLLLDHSVDVQTFWVKAFASSFAKPLWWFVGGRATFFKSPEEFPEYQRPPWMIDEE